MAKRKPYFADDESFALGQALERARVEDGLSQQTLAGRLKTSQATVCKISKKGHKPRPLLAKRIRDYLGPRWPLYAIGSREWLVMVKNAAEKSQTFATLLTSAIAIMNEVDEL